jgi:hypothetical protein
VGAHIQLKQPQQATDAFINGRILEAVLQQTTERVHQWTHPQSISVPVKTLRKDKMHDKDSV